MLTTTLGQRRARPEQARHLHCRESLAASRVERHTVLQDVPNCRARPRTAGLKEEFGGSMIVGEDRDVVNRLAHHRMGVGLQLAVPACPPVLIQLDDAK